MNKLFKIKIIQPTFDVLYNEHEKYFKLPSPKRQLLKELKEVQALVEEADRGGRKNGHAMAGVLNKAIPLVKKVDNNLYEELKQNVAAFQHFYTVDMTYEIGNTFLPYLRRSVNIVDQAVRYLEVEEKFPDTKENEKKEQSVVRSEAPLKISDSQFHFGSGDNVGRDKIVAGKGKDDEPFLSKILWKFIIPVSVIIIAALILYYKFGIK